MKKTIILFLTLCSAMSVDAQIKDDFETNKLGWTEYSSNRSEAIIMDGHMHLVSKNDDEAFTVCYPALDVTRNFEIKCDVLAKKIDDDKSFGIVIDYLDNYNYTVFLVTEGLAMFKNVRENKVVGRIYAPIKLKEQKKANVELKIKSSFQKVEFFVNGMKALERRFLHMESNGIGLLAGGKQKIDFDNFEVTQ